MSTDCHVTDISLVLVFLLICNLAMEKYRVMYCIIMVFSTQHSSCNYTRRASCCLFSNCTHRVVCFSCRENQIQTINLTIKSFQAGMINCCKNLLQIAAKKVHLKLNNESGEVFPIYSSLNII